MVDFCEHCGTILTNDTIFHGRVQQRIYEFIRENPNCSRQQIMDGVYGANKPATFNTVSVHLHSMRSTLGQLGIRIKTRRGPRATYRLIKDH